LSKFGIDDCYRSDKVNGWNETTSCHIHLEYIRTHIEIGYMGLDVIVEFDACCVRMKDD
jgi:hypothetical protein